MFLYFLIITGAAVSAACCLFYRARKNRMLKEQRQFVKDGQLRLHMVSETEWVTKGQGVHTAFVEMLELLADQPDLSIVVNGQGAGNVFHSHTYGPYYFLKGWRYKGRRILTAHVIPDSSKGTLPFWEKLMPFTTAYLKLAYRYADVVIAISPTVEREIKKLGIKSRIVRINNPILTDKWLRTHENRDRIRKQLNIANDEKLVIGVGQLQQRKGVEDFIDIAAAMPEAKFVWVGGRPWGTFTEGIKRIDDRISQAPANLQFTGLLDLDDMPAMYAAADVFLFPSYQENCPLAPLEAAAAGLPIVFRDLDEYRSLYNGGYLKAVNTTEFIAITRKLLTCNDFYYTGTQYSEKLLAAFDQQLIRRQLIALYREMLQT